MNRRLFTGVFFFVSLPLMSGQSYACPILKAIIGRSDVRPCKPTWVYTGGLGTGFTGSESVGSIVNCTWSLPGASDPNYGTYRYLNDTVSCKFGTVGQYTVRLTVTDDEGRTDTDTCTVYVVSIVIGIAPGESSYVAVNNDDDNENGVMDLFTDEVTVEHEDNLPYDLRKIRLYVQTPKTSDKVVLWVGPDYLAGRMRIWTQREKVTKLIETPDDYKAWVYLPAWSSLEPHDVYLEAERSCPENDKTCVGFSYVGIDGSTTPPTERFPESNPPAPIYFTLLEVDVDMEGVQDDYYGYGPETEETKPGGFIVLNDDDDNNNETPDKDEGGVVAGEDDLVKIILRKVVPTNIQGVVTLNAIAGGSKIKAWESATKGTLVTLPKTYATPTELPKELWVEGVETSSTARDITLALQYGGFDDRIRATVVKVEITHIKFNHSAGDSADGIDIRENYSTDISIPEWVNGGQNKPAAYKKETNVTIQARFTVSPSIVASAKIRAITSDPILGWLGEQMVSFSEGVSSPEYISFTPTYCTPLGVDKGTVTWEWKVRDIDGGGSPERDIGSSGPHTIYTVVDTPTTPMAEPWTEVLDQACYVASGRNMKATAMHDIWDAFYNMPVGYYDTENGSSQYTGATTESFDLTSWMCNYTDCGIVNCYDMGKAVVIFANALGCGSSYSFVSSFGYLNCIKPIGRGWTNNPFYDHGSPVNPNPIVDGDWSTTDGRSKFSNHAFSMLGSDIFDGSGGKVDVDADPDGAPHTAHILDGNDTWTNNYKNRVIDNNPPSSPTNPTNYNFTVY